MKKILHGVFATIFTLFLSLGNVLFAATYNVTNNAASGVGSFDDAITWVNANAGTAPHTITFSNALDGLTIPSITGRNLTCPNVTIDGTTMAAYACGNPRVLINCNAFNAWQWTGSGCTIRGVRINGGIQLNGTGGHRVLSCVFNIDFAGAAMASSAKACVRTNVAGTINNIIGGLSSCERNVMAGIGGMCIVFDNSGAGNQVLGNYMGTNVTGLAPLGTGFTTRVIGIEAGSNFIIDGNTMGNVVGGSQGQAIFVNGGSGFTIRNNNIGAGADRLVLTGFGFAGNMAIYFNGNGDNSTLTNNVVCNAKFIVSAGVAGNVITVESADNVNMVQNYIGVDINFNKSGSSWAGIYYYSGSTNATINGNYIGDCGITSGQRSHGVALFNIAGTYNVINNYVGVSPTGIDIGNGDAGIEVNTSSSAYTLNITGNFIGFNKCQRATSPGSLTSESGGIRVIDGKTITISNNYIGTLTGGRANCGNLANGIGIEGSSPTSMTISNNVIAYNGKNGIQTYGNGPDRILISQNCIFCNTREGIELTNGTLGSPGGGVGNTSFGRSFATVDGAKNVQISTSGPWVSNFAGSPFVLRGYAPAGSSVEIYQNHHCICDAATAFSGAESMGGRSSGIDYLATVVADAQGRWTYNLATNVAKNGLTVTAVDFTNRRTSEFSPCVSLTLTCLPPVTVTTSGSTSLTPCVGDPFSLAGSATFLRTSCYNNYYYSWLRNGVVIYGPSLTYAPYSVVAAADPADDGNYVLRVEDGNAGNASCYLQSSPAIAVDVVPCPPLFVSILHFAGTSLDEYNDLSWIIDTDEKLKVELESSIDGRNYQSLMSYQIASRDDQRYKDYTQESVTYYRLKITPENGVAYYSRVVTLAKNTAISIALVNNITEDQLAVQVSSNGDEIVKYSVIDVKGVLVAEGVLTVSSGINRYQVSVAGLPAAMYLIKFEAAGQGYIKAERFIRR